MDGGFHVPSLITVLSELEMFERQWTARVCMCVYVCVGMKGTYCYSQSERGLDGTWRVHTCTDTLVRTWFVALT